MLNIEQVAIYLETLLNTTSNKYKVYYWENHLNSIVEQQYEDNVPTTKIEVIPCIIENMSGKIRPIPNETIIDGELILDCLFPATKTADALVLSDFLKEQLNAQVKVINSNNVLFGMNPPIMVSADRVAIKTLADDFPNANLKTDVDYYIMVQFVFNYTSSLLYFGNSVKYWLSLDNVSFTELKRIDNQNILSKYTMEEQLIGDSYSKSISEMSGIGKSITFILSSFNGIFRTLLDDIEIGNNQNRIYYLTKDYQNGIAYTYPVILTKGSVNDQLGSVITLTCEFARKMI